MRSKEKYGGNRLLKGRKKKKKKKGKQKRGKEEEDSALKIPYKMKDICEEYVES
jgi:hypothetical protein